MGVELELQGNSTSDVVADTHETLETTVEEPNVEQGPRPRSKWELSLSCRETRLVML